MDQGKIPKRRILSSRETELHNRAHGGFPVETWQRRQSFLLAQVHLGRSGRHVALLRQGRQKSQGHTQSARAKRGFVTREDSQSQFHATDVLEGREYETYICQT